MKDIFSTLSLLEEAWGGTDDARQALVMASWRRAAGAVLSKRARPIQLTGRDLEIAVADRTWQRQLAVHAPEILSKLNAVLKGSYVDRLVFVISPSAFPDKTSPAETIAPPPAEVPPATAAAAEKIAHPGLRDQFLKAAAASRWRLDR